MSEYFSGEKQSLKTNGKVIPEKTSRPFKNGRLVRRTFVIALVLVSISLIAGGATEIYLRYKESVESVWILQSEMARGAAFKIDQFVRQIENTMRASTQTPETITSGLTESFNFELIKLLKIVPPIITVAALDSEGNEQFKTSRTQMVQPEDLKNRSSDQAFLQAIQDKPFYGPVYFVQESEPFMDIAVPIKRLNKVAGVMIAEVNLKHIWNVVSEIEAGETGYAYVVSQSGKLIAHPDISLVLKGRNLSNLIQVQAALSRSGKPLAAQPNFEDRMVFAAYAFVPELEWAVIVERSTDEAYATLYSSIIRTTVLLLVGFGIAVLTSLLIGRRVVKPLETLRQGANRIGNGELDHRIEIKTGDELESLADEFNQMTFKLKESYAVNERISQLKRFFSPQLAEHIVSSGETQLTDSHRREITVIFCDLRDFTAFSATAEPETTMQVLLEYYDAICSLLNQFEATIEHFAGDGLMAFFNDPVPCDDPEERAVKMALLMQEKVSHLLKNWHRKGIKLGFGIGISSGYATLGHIGSAEQFHYAAIGNVANLASRLCDQAESGQILISESVYVKTENIAVAESIGDFSLKGFPDPVPILKVTGLKRVAP